MRPEHTEQVGSSHTRNHKNSRKSFFFLFFIMSIMSKAFWGNFYIVKSDNRFTLHFLFIMVILGKSHFSPPKLHGFVLSV